MSLRAPSLPHCHCEHLKGAWQSLRVVCPTKFKFVGITPSDRERSVTKGLNENDCFHCVVVRDIIESGGDKNKQTLTEG